MKYFKLLISLFVILTFNNAVFANMIKCPWSGGGVQTFPVSFGNGNLNVDPNVAVGGVIATSGSGLDSIKTTPGPWTLYFKYASGSPGVYNAVPTNIKGVGVRMSISGVANSYYPTQVTGHCKALVACMGDVPSEWNSEKVELIKTSDSIGSGALSTAVFAYAQCDNGQRLNNWAFKSTNIISTTCNLDTTSLDVGLGNYRTSDFISPGNTTEKKQFSIPVNCSGAGPSFTLKVSSVSVADQSNGVIALDSGGATGLGVQLLQGDGATPAPLNGNSWNAGVANSGENNIILYARYYQLEQTVTSGSANATATLTFNYK